MYIYKIFESCNFWDDSFLIEILGHDNQYSKKEFEELMKQVRNIISNEEQYYMHLSNTKLKNGQINESKIPYLIKKVLIERYNFYEIDIAEYELGYNIKICDEGLMKIKQKELDDYEKLLKN